MEVFPSNAPYVEHQSFDRNLFSRSSTVRRGSATWCELAIMEGSRRAGRTTKSSQLKWILRDRSMFLLAEASPSRSLGHRQKRSQTPFRQSWQRHDGVRWRFQTQFSFACMSETTPHDNVPRKRWNQRSGCRSMVSYHQKWDVRGQQRKRRSCRKNTSEDFDTPNTAEIDT